jgi:hypothetical protein
MFENLRRLRGFRVAVLETGQREIPVPDNSEITQASAYVFAVSSPLTKISGPATGDQYVRTISVSVHRRRKIANSRRLHHGKPFAAVTRQ